MAVKNLYRQSLKSVDRGHGPETFSQTPRALIALTHLLGRQAARELVDCSLRGKAEQETAAHPDDGFTGTNTPDDA